MTLASEIRRLAAQIAARFHPQRIILFGSHAYGAPTRDSDVDLLVVMPCRGPTIDMQIEILQAIDAPFPLDVLVRTPEDIARRISLNDFFIQEIMTRGKLLYEADAGMSAQSRCRLPKRSARAARTKKSQSRRRLLSRAAVR